MFIKKKKKILAEKKEKTRMSWVVKNFSIFQFIVVDLIKDSTFT